MHTINAGDAMTRLSMSTRLRKAVEQKQWMLHYQPLIELDSGRMYGVEALIRWPEPNGGLVPPGEFIPLAEEMGLIEAIGDWVVEEICRQDAQWRAEGLELEVGIQPLPAPALAARARGEDGGADRDRRHGPAGGSPSRSPSRPP